MGKCAGEQSSKERGNGHDYPYGKTAVGFERLRKFFSKKFICIRRTRAIWPGQTDIAPETEPSDLNNQDTTFVFHIDFDWIKVQLAAQRRVGNIYGSQFERENDPA